MRSNLELNQLEDDTAYIQFDYIWSIGQTYEREFTYFNKGTTEEFETENEHCFFQFELSLS